MCLTIEFIIPSLFQESKKDATQSDVICNGLFLLKKIIYRDKIMRQIGQKCHICLLRKIEENMLFLLTMGTKLRYGTFDQKT